MLRSHIHFAAWGEKFQERNYELWNQIYRMVVEAICMSRIFAPVVLGTMCYKVVLVPNNDYRNYALTK